MKIAFTLTFLAFSLVSFAQEKLNPINHAKKDLIGWWKVNDNSGKTFGFMNVSEVDSNRLLIDFTDEYDAKTGISKGWVDLSEYWILKIKSDTLYIKNNLVTPDKFPVYRREGKILIIKQGEMQTEYMKIENE